MIAACRLTAPGFGIGDARTEPLHFADVPPHLGLEPEIEAPEPACRDRRDDAAQTEDATARNFAEELVGRAVFDHVEQSWFTWTGERWARDETGEMLDRARLFCERRYEALAPQVRRTPSQMRRIAFARNVEAAARSDPRLAVTANVWDTDHLLLGVPGGVIDLRTGETLPPDPARYISRETAVAPAAPGTPAPIWEKFLSEATGGDAEFAAFLQRLFGYFLTGFVNEEIVSFIYGPGGSGKGTLSHATVDAMGEYARSMPIEAFTQQSRLNPEYYRADMFGYRLITASEPSAGVSWNEALLKEISGNENPLSARKPYGRPFTFRPVCKIQIIGNSAPKLQGRTPEMERRLRVSPFNNRPARADGTLKERLRAEKPQILRWMVEGCLSWQREGLGTCEAVRAASESYFLEMDSFRQWLEERCILDPSLAERPGTLLASFNEWTKSQGRAPMDGVGFAETVDRTPGLARKRSNGVRLVVGIGLRVAAGERDAA